MDRYKNNAKLLVWLSPFRSLSLSAAYLAPFFLEKGLSQTEIFMLQSIFSVAYLLWEIPSGYLADKFGRANSIKLSGPIAAVSMIAYGFSDHLWQFILCELALAIANGLLSGADTALLYDSLKADDREDEFVGWKQRINSVGFGSVALAVPLAVFLVNKYGVAATLIADGLLLLLAQLIVYRLKEPPRHSYELEEIEESAFKAVLKLLRNPAALWLMILSASLSASTYFAFWLSAPYYALLGLPLASFSILFAARSLWKAWLSHKFTAEHHVRKSMIRYSWLILFAYLAMASGQLWLLWAVLSLDIVQALHAQPLLKKLNAFMASEYRATLNSLSSLINRIVFASAGPVLGMVVDEAGLAISLVVMGIAGSVVSAIAIRKLVKLKVL